MLWPLDSNSRIIVHECLTLASKPETTHETDPGSCFCGNCGCHCKKPANTLTHHQYSVYACMCMNDRGIMGSLQIHLYSTENICYQWYLSLCNFYRTTRTHLNRMWCLILTCRESETLNKSTMTKTSVIVFLRSPTGYCHKIWCVWYEDDSTRK